MKKAMTAILLACAMLAALAGCGEKDSGSSAPAKETGASATVSTAAKTTAADNSGSVPAAGTIIDDKEPGEGLELNKLSFAGEWKSGNDPKCQGGTNHYTWATNAFYQFKFNGTQFELWSELGLHMGISDVYIDGKKVDSIDYYGEENYPYKNYTSPTLEQGEHTVKVVNSGKLNPDSTGGKDGCCISIDYVVVR